MVDEAADEALMEHLVGRLINIADMDLAEQCLTWWEMGQREGRDVV